MICENRYFNGVFLIDPYFAWFVQFLVAFLSPSGILLVLEVPPKVSASRSPQLIVASTGDSNW